jgi:hypothetical protein
LHLILCEDVAHDPQNRARLNITRFIPLLGWPAGSTTPLRLERLVALLILTDGRGTGRGRIGCIYEETGQPIFQSDEQVITFRDRDPSLPRGVTFTMRDCRFPTPGAYLVQFFFEDEVIFQQSLIVR